MLLDAKLFATVLQENVSNVSCFGEIHLCNLTPGCKIYNNYNYARKPDFTKKKKKGTVTDLLYISVKFWYKIPLTITCEHVDTYEHG